MTAPADPAGDPAAVDPATSDPVQTTAPSRAAGPSDAAVLPGAAASRRRPTRAELDRIFGVDPVSTRDDLPDPEVPTGRDPAEAWYLENRPPHHG